MPVKFTLDGTDISVVEGVEFKSNVILTKLRDRMENLMFRLQEKIQEKTIGFIKESIRDPIAYIEGTRVIGAVTWGGAPTTVSYKGGKEYDIAKLLNYGGVKALYPIEALGVKGQLAGQRPHRKKSEGGIKREGADMLGILTEGKGSPSKKFPGKRMFFREHVFHKKIKARRFIGDSIDEMRPVFNESLTNVVRDILKQKKSSIT